MPDTSILSALKGQPRAADYLLKTIKKPQGGYIFFGPDGVGKRTAAILFAAAINQPSFSEGIFTFNSPDILPLFPFRAPSKVGQDKWLEEWGVERGKYRLGQRSPELNPSWVISIGDMEKELAGTIRDLRRQMRYSPSILDYRVALVFDFDRVREEAANAFLKTLEEPQAQSIFILTTSRPFALPATIRSRCKLVRFNALDDEVITEKLLNEGYSETEVQIAVDLAFGSMKQAYLYLEDRDSLISPEVLSFLEKPSLTDIELVRFIDKLSYRVSLEKIMTSFFLVFRWMIKARSGRKPRWQQLAQTVESLSSRLSRDSLVNNMMLTERMSSRVVLNPTPSLFFYHYLSSLRLTS